MLELDGRTYKKRTDVDIKFVVHCTPDDEKAGGVVLEVVEFGTGKPLPGSGMTFHDVRSGQCWCINAGYIVEHEYKGGKKRG